MQKKALCVIIYSMEQKIFDIINNEIKCGSLKKMIFSRPVDRDVVRVCAKPFLHKGEVLIQFETFTADGKAKHRNLTPADAAREAADMAYGKFRQCNIFSTGGECEIKVSKSGKIFIVNHIKTHESAELASHNKKKNTVLKDGEPHDFLIALGVTDREGRVFDKKRSKFRQINRFLEIIDDVYASLPTMGRLTVYDLCCGKSYLTFAAYYYFTELKKRDIIMYGVDLKKDVIDYCKEVAEKSGFDKLHFECGDISRIELGQADMVISLHACDIATDIVLANACRLGAKVILSTPCCHHEMMRQMECEKLSFITKHSMLKQKLCDAATDALRAMRLEAEGYKVTTLELIDPEETPKNIMIKAVRHKISDEKREQILAEYRKICGFLSVDPYLDRILTKGEKK